MLQKTQMTGRATVPAYAMPRDFCEIFTAEMNSLYLLALLLTADEEMAEHCFTAALKDCRKVSGVFKQWAHTWARRAIIQNAISLAKPSPETADGVSTRSTAGIRISGHERDARLAAVTELPAFERFVFVMSVLESYSDQECRILLGCFRHEVIESRSRALAFIGESAQNGGKPSVQAHRAAAAGAGSLDFIPVNNSGPNVDFRRFRSTQG